MSPALPEAQKAVYHLRRWVTAPAWLSLLLALALSLFVSPARRESLAFLPLLVSVLLLGLPHGAWDHRVIPAIRHQPIRARFIAKFCGIYGGLVLGYGLLWTRLPTAAFLIFLAMSWLHWGQGDATYLNIWDHRAARTGTLTWLVRGGAPIALPILTHPEAFARVAAGVTDRFRSGDPLGPEPWLSVLSLEARLAGLLLLGILVLLYLSRTYRLSRLDAAEVVLLYTVFALADPIFAVGVYFCLWHSLRHIARLLLLDDGLRELCVRGEVHVALYQFGKQTLAILVASLAVLGCAYLKWERTVSSPEEFVYLYLALIAALTFPHLLLVLWLDLKSPSNGS